MSLDVDLIEVRRVSVHSQNITHNLTTMADEAELYRPLWRPKECGVAVARDLIGPLYRGIRQMERNPLYFRQFDAPNGWGTYDQFLPWLRELKQRCEDYPDAEVVTDG